MCVYISHFHLCFKPLILLNVKSFLLSGILYSDSLHRHVKRSPSIFRSHPRLMVKSLVHRASLSLSLSMLSLTTLPFPLLWPSPPNFAWIKRTSPFRRVNYRPLLAMSGSSNIKPLLFSTALKLGINASIDSCVVNNVSLNMLCWNIINESIVSYSVSLFVLVIICLKAIH